MAITRWKTLEEINWDLSTNMYEENNSIIIEIHVPDIDPDKVDIKVENNHLHISGSRKEKQEVTDRSYYHKEVKYGSFERVIELPEPVDSEKVHVNYKDGVLKIGLPKK